MPSLEVMEVAVEQETTNVDVMDCDDDDDDRTVEMTDEEANSLSPEMKIGESSTAKDQTFSSDDKPASSSIIDLCKDDVVVVLEAPSATKGKNSKKRNVTPIEEEKESCSSTKKKQQKKVNQLTLGSFFFAAKNNQTSSPVSKPPVVRKRKQSTPVQASSDSSDVEIVKVEPSPKKAVARKTMGEKKQSGSPVVSPCKSKDENDPALEQSDEDDVKKATTETQDSAEDKPINLGTDAPSSPKGLEGETTAEESTSEKPSQDSESKRDSSNNDTTPDAVEPMVIDCTEEPAKESERVVEELSEDRKVLLQKHEDTRIRYVRRSQELIKEGRGGLDEEDFTMPEPQQSELESSSDQEFPDSVVANMALLIEGSSLPLTKVAASICAMLTGCHEKQWSEETVTTKIKLLAKRKSHFNLSSGSSTVDLFEDENENRLWRWEIIAVELLPSAIIPKVRKVRTARKKLSSHHAATLRLVQSLKDAESVIRDTKRNNLDAVLAKISRDEEKVLKYEREAEKQRLALQTQRKKLEEIESKKREKEQQIEEKRKEKERKKLEAENRKLEKEKEKEEAQQVREGAKRKKTQEREKREEQKKQEAKSKNNRLNKQKACLMSFFAAPKQEPKEKVPSAIKSDPSAKLEPMKSSHDTCSTTDSLKTKDFCTLINSTDTHESHRPLFEQLSSNAVNSRKRRTRNVAVTVFVTVMPEANAFGAQPFAEQTEIIVPNKYQFLSFREDHRPAYHGTWSKTSSIVTGRNPFGKDTSYLDYDYDSEAEWEEGDNEVGEDVEDEDKNKEEDMEDEDGDIRVYDYDDGFCVADDQYLDTDENVDEETKALYKKTLQKDVDAGVTVNRVCIIAPAAGGVPLGGKSFSEATHVEGFNKQAAMDLLTAHQGIRLLEETIWLDAFPPVMIDEDEQLTEAGSPKGGNTTKDEYTPDEMRELARFVHHCTLNSKEKLIEELRSARPDSFGSRAKAIRKLDSIALKKKHPRATGVYWEVKKEVLEELGLQDVLAQKLPGVDETSAEENSKKKESLSNNKVSKSKPTTKQNKKQKSEESAPVDKVENKTKLATSTTNQSKKRKSEESAPLDKVEKKTKVAPESKTSSSPRKIPTKKSPPPVMAASANLLASFLIKPKKKAKVESPKAAAAATPAK